MAAIDGLQAAHLVLLDVLSTYIDTHGQGPRIAEIVELTGVSRSTVCDRLSVLEARGYIERAGGGSTHRLRLREKALTWSTV